jgi:hypothetical protein
MLLKKSLHFHLSVHVDLELHDSPNDLKLYDYVTFYIDGVQLYLSKSNAYELFIRVKSLSDAIHKNECAATFVRALIYHNIRPLKTGTI